jgi:hypothetical protein
MAAPGGSEAAAEAEQLQPSAERVQLETEPLAKRTKPVLLPPPPPPPAHLKALNPPVEVDVCIARPAHRAAFPVYVIRDDRLVGGTKQRALGALLEASRAEEFVYAGPVFGFAQVALAHVARVYRKSATVVVRRQHNGLYPLTQRARNLGAKVIEVPPPGRLADVQAAAEHYVAEVNRGRPPDAPKAELLSFGLHCPLFMDTLEGRLREALPRELLSRPPVRLWLVAGSATLLAVFARLWPSTTFLVVQVGKTIWDDQRG